jgi:hypothetical protein
MKIELLKPEDAQIQVQDVTPLVLLQMAMSQGADIDKLTALMGLQERWEANQARKAFAQAMSDFKAEPIIIARDKTNSQYLSKYASIGSLVNTVTPFLSKHGLSADWSIDQASGIEVSCTMTHALGHSVTKSMKVPLDSSGAKNPIQQIKSSVTYARILTFECACGLASTEANLDDDGNGSSGSKSTQMDLSEFSRHMELVENATSIEALQGQFKEAYLAAQKYKDQGAMKQIMGAKEKRKKELKCE